jgi:hypothetical protein
MGFLPILCEICTLIYHTENLHLKEIIDKHEKFNNLYKTIIENIKDRFAKGLLYNLNSSKITSNLSMDSEDNREEEKPGLPFKDIISDSM